MKRQYSTWLWLLLALPFFAQAVPFATGISESSSGYIEGKHYKTLDPAINMTGETIEVREFFSYACPHCFSFESTLSSWQKTLPADVVFERTPVVFRQNWEPLARAYYVGEAMGTTDEAHVEIFESMHIKRQNLTSQQALSALYTQQQLDTDKFNQLYNSFGVTTKMKQGDALMRQARISGVPAVLVNGKYLITSGDAGGFEEMLKVVDYLVIQERTAKQANAQ